MAQWGQHDDLEPTPDSCQNANLEKVSLGQFLPLCSPSGLTACACVATQIWTCRSCYPSFQTRPLRALVAITHRPKLCCVLLHLASRRVRIFWAAPGPEARFSATSVELTGSFRHRDCFVRPARPIWPTGVEWHEHVCSVCTTILLYWFWCLGVCGHFLDQRSVITDHYTLSGGLVDLV